MFHGSGNRDEDVFGPNADRFDVTRTDAHRHIAFGFGFGEHVCIGAARARIEGRILFEELLARWPAWEPAGAVVPLHSPLVNGLVHLPVQRRCGSQKAWTIFSTTRHVRVVMAVP